MNVPTIPGDEANTTVPTSPPTTPPSMSISTNVLSGPVDSSEFSHRYNGFASPTKQPISSAEIQPTNRADASIQRKY
jgi:hypothetical protein